MKYTALIVTLVLTLFSSCGRNVGDRSPYYSSGRTKPVVAVAPMIDSTQSTHVRWSLSEEFTSEIQKRIYHSQDLYLLRQELSEACAHALNKVDVGQIDPTITNALGGAEFVIVTELLDQSESSYEDHVATASEVGGLFSIAMRVRILDMREATPKVILQEVIDHDHVIPRFYLTCDYEKIPWGSTAFERTPMGMAHGKVIKELFAHVEGYIGAIKG